MDIPSPCQLEIIGLPVFLDIFIHGGKGEAFCERFIVPCIGRTAQIGIIVRKTVGSSTIILDMYGEWRLPETQFAGNLPISGGNTFAGIIHIDKEIGTTPFIRLEHLDRRGQNRAPVQVLIIKSTSKIIM